MFKSPSAIVSSSISLVVTESAANWMFKYVPETSPLKFVEVVRSFEVS